MSHMRYRTARQGRSRTRRLLLTAVLLAVAAGCSGDQPAEETPTGTAAPTTSTTTTTVPVPVELKLTSGKTKQTAKYYPVFQDVAASIPLEERPTMRDWLDRFNAGLKEAA